VAIEDEVAIMRRIPLFAGIETLNLRRLAAICKRLDFDPGQILFQQGDHAEAAFVVIQGSADILIETDNGAAVIATAKDNDVIGELAVLCDIPRTATVRAKSELKTLQILRDDFLELVRSSPEAACEILRIIGKRLAERTLEVARLRSSIKAE
jgi:CRP-like cAMP-binding protein